MMNRLAEAVKEMVGTECTVRFQEVEKNNGLVLQSITIQEPGAMIAPTLYIDRLLERVRTGEISLQDAAGEIAGIYRNFQNNKSGISDIVSSLNKEYILERVVYQMVNMEKNAGRLADMPYKELLDLAAIYRVVIREDASETASIAVSRAFCDMYSITEDELDAAARRNTEMKGFCVQTMASVLAEITGMPEETVGLDISMWVISNPARLNGASVMLYSSCFDSLARKLGSDLYVLPSSIHEVLAVPVGKMNPDELRDMVCLINAGEVEADEVLSGNVYRYSCEENKLVIV